MQFGCHRLLHISHRSVDKIFYHLWRDQQPLPWTGANLKFGRNVCFSKCYPLFPQPSISQTQFQILFHWLIYFAVEAFERQICFAPAQVWAVHIGGYCIHSVKTRLLFGLEKLGLHHFNLYCASLTWTMSPLKAAASRLTSKLRRAVTCKSWWLGAIVHCTELSGAVESECLPEEDFPTKSERIGRLLHYA